MSMLAESRRKQKWTLNPRGKLWSDDSNKFGQKMLEKMGWSSGKGLGVNEQGMTEHIRIAFKNDQAGIGFSNSNQDKLWTEQQESFNELLQNLQEVKDPSIVGSTMKNEIETDEKSLEMKSKRSRARVHYQKFTRGKDVNKYSTKDLANIFGKKDLVESTEVETNDDKSNETQLNNSVGAIDKTGGILTITGGTMDNYFKHKIPKVLKTEKNCEINETAAQSESDGERYVGFGFSQSKTKLPKENLKINNYSFINPTLDVNVSDHTVRKRKSDLSLESSSLNNDVDDDDVAINDNQTLKKRKKLKNYSFENPALDLACTKQTDCVKNNKMEHSRSSVDELVVNNVHQDNEVYENKNKVIGHENDALDLTDEATGKKRVTFNDIIEYNTDSININKKKKKKKKHNKNKLDKFEVELDKSVKKKLKSVCLTPEKNSFINEALDVEVIDEELIDNETNERKSTKTKRKKIRPVLNLDTIKEEEDTAVQVDNKIVIEEIILDNTVDERKKKRRRDKNIVNDVTPVELSVENNTTEIDESDQVSTLKINKKKKKKIKDRNKIEINQEEEVAVNENEKINSVKLQDDLQIKGKKEKKEKKKNEQRCEILSDIEVNKKINNDINCINNNELEECKMKKPKKIFKALFAHSPIAHFIGSNVNELKGYGVE